MAADTPAPAAFPPDYLDLAGLAATLSASKRTVTRLLSAGRLPPSDMNIGAGTKGRRWNRQNVLNWLAAGRQGGRHV